MAFDSSGGVSRIVKAGVPALTGLETGRELFGASRIAKLEVLSTRVRDGLQLPVDFHARLPAASAACMNGASQATTPAI
jgi:hypothetical protein